MKGQKIGTFEIMASIAIVLAVLGVAVIVVGV